MADPVTYVPYAPRTVTPRDVADVAGYRMKAYRVVHPARPYDADLFEGARALVPGALPQPVAPAEGRPGVGFVIEHQGADVEYLVLGWWDRQNELPIRVWVREHNEWRKARDNESICVWDLEIIWFERRAWVETGLSGSPVSTATSAYLARTFEGAGGR